MKTEMTDQTHQVALFMSKLVVMIIEGTFPNCLVREFNIYIKKMFRKAYFFEQVEKKQPISYPKAIDLFTDLFLFLWGSKPPKTEDTESKNCFDKLILLRNQLCWEKMTLIFMLKDFEQLDMEYLTGHPKEKRFWIAYFDGNYQFLQDKEILTVSEKNSPTVIMECRVDKDLLTICYFKSMFYGL
ncbi:MAG: hypothetical protein UT48_C0036G0003 [Parcubacteria group bacterium GW2011_GWE2_39_37]|uniref:Uncharacterized protein n=1 Tax=Candidatus Falkowbacteria bacterium GW2011_GWF2_39_8 TaxID=1618642 RepID=A0A0G0Q7H4_9BACT|nr:MAG: hypothetical protein UT48_C0036G0003 [Parcubacteria group bacterium GW2011_GWE2_39_37]KKR33276.1 MAG: hypothetical protein UT64_C0011G0009 [Candidatus Falkowbacteria bacterium GW2011_GWF2_39_8]